MIWEQQQFLEPPRARNLSYRNPHAFDYQHQYILDQEQALKRQQLWEQQQACIQQPVWHHQQIQHQQSASSDSEALAAEQVWLERQQQIALEWHESRKMRQADIQQWILAEQRIWSAGRDIEWQFREQFQEKLWIQDQERQLIAHRIQERHEEMQCQAGVWLETQPSIAEKLVEHQRAAMCRELEAVTAHRMDDIQVSGLQGKFMDVDMAMVALTMEDCEAARPRACQSLSGDRGEIAEHESGDMMELQEDDTRRHGLIAEGGPAPDGQREVFRARISRSMDMALGSDDEVYEDERSCGCHSLPRRLTV